MPVLLIVLADLRELAAMDRDNGRYTFVGGATVYPFAWNIMLAARDQGLVGVLTTLFSRTEPEVREALGIPAEFSIAAAIALGHPLEEPAEPGRATVDQFTSIDELSGAALCRGRPATARFLISCEHFGRTGNAFHPAGPAFTYDPGERRRLRSDGGGAADERR